MTKPAPLTELSVMHGPKGGGFKRMNMMSRYYMICIFESFSFDIPMHDARCTTITAATTYTTLDHWRKNDTTIRGNLFRLSYHFAYASAAAGSNSNDYGEDKLQGI